MFGSRVPGWGFRLISSLEAFIHALLSRAYLAIARLSCWHSNATYLSAYAIYARQGTWVFQIVNLLSADEPQRNCFTAVMSTLKSDGEMQLAYVWMWCRYWSCDHYCREWCKGSMATERGKWITGLTTSLCLWSNIMIQMSCQFGPGRDLARQMGRGASPPPVIFNNKRRTVAAQTARSRCKVTIHTVVRLLF